MSNIFLRKLSLCYYIFSDINAPSRRAKSYMETEQYEDAVRDYETIFKTDKSNREYR